ncbi:hypothetical protein Hypma_002292 [Hypsizygus marmoreus]|uniref:Fungal-type protein kinase domain-containing protein n=1 Tax=Hypsizygus marmoreus TaxID=39966 RepID=A0A369K017_HYPMA|nr:hypothetical protein Hypma_002292 [Hypsizygus marmoreus]
MLVGKAFVKAWLDCAKCHSLLWIHGMQRYGDASLLHMLYSPDEGCGFLMDYDLSISSTSVRDRKGTIPLMALELLHKKYWAGTFKRLYHHELEAFIWILPFVFLRYQDKIPQAEELVTKWMTSDYTQCHKEKCSFSTSDRLLEAGTLVQPDFQNEWNLVTFLITWILGEQERRGRAKLYGKPVVNPDMMYVWLEFTQQLRSVGSAFPLQLAYIGELVDELGLEKMLSVEVDDGVSGTLLALPRTYP